MNEPIAEDAAPPRRASPWLFVICLLGVVAFVALLPEWVEPEASQSRSSAPPAARSVGPDAAAP